MGKKKEKMVVDETNGDTTTPEATVKLVETPLVTIPEEVFFVEDEASFGPEFHLVETKVKVGTGTDGNKLLSCSNTVDLGDAEYFGTELDRMIEMYGADEVLSAFQKASVGKVANCQRKAVRTNDTAFAARIGLEWATMIQKRGKKTKSIDKDQVMRDNLKEKHNFTDEQIDAFLASNG